MYITTRIDSVKHISYPHTWVSLRRIERVWDAAGGLGAIQRLSNSCSQQRASLGDSGLGPFTAAGPYGKPGPRGGQSASVPTGETSKEPLPLKSHLLPISALLTTNYHHQHPPLGARGRAWSHMPDCSESDVGTGP